MSGETDAAEDLLHEGHSASSEALLCWLSDVSRLGAAALIK